MIVVVCQEGRVERGWVGFASVLIVMIIAVAIAGEVPLLDLLSSDGFFDGDFDIRGDFHPCEGSELGHPSTS